MFKTMPYTYPKRNSRDRTNQQHRDYASFDITIRGYFTGKPLIPAFPNPQYTVTTLNDQAAPLAFLDHGFITIRDGDLAYMPKNIQKR